MSHGTFLGRLLRGTRWSWADESYAPALPADLGETAWTLSVADRYHAKQGRSTGRIRFDAPGRSLSVYLKRHERLPWRDRLLALILPSRGPHSPAAAEWEHLRRAREIGVPVPDVVAVGEAIGPWGELRSFLMVAELVGCEALNETLPGLVATIEPGEFARLKRSLIREMAEITARLHGAKAFHKDLYLCHFYLDLGRLAAGEGRFTLIDLHRLGVHRWAAARWRVKDLGQLLYSTFGVAGIDDRDRLRFWKHYRRLLALRSPGWQARAVRAKAARYLAHNR